MPLWGAGGALRKDFFLKRRIETIIKGSQNPLRPLPGLAVYTFSSSPLLMPTQTTFYNKTLILYMAGYLMRSLVVSVFLMTTVCPHKDSLYKA